VSNPPDFEIIARLSADHLSTQVAPDTEVATYGEAVARSYRDTPADARGRTHRRGGCVVSIVANSELGMGNFPSVVDQPVPKCGFGKPHLGKPRTDT
jgi:hypothetical protein